MRQSPWAAASLNADTDPYPTLAGNQMDGGAGGGREGRGGARAGTPLVNGRTCVDGVEANRCARGIVKGNEREWHKWNLIKRGARASEARQWSRRRCVAARERADTAQHR